jgi:hypothetical protein
MLQGEERDAILEVEIRCLFLSAPMGCKCSNHIIQRVHIVHTFLARLGLPRVWRPCFSLFLLRHRKTAVGLHRGPPLTSR